MFVKVMVYGSRFIENSGNFINLEILVDAFLMIKNHIQLRIGSHLLKKSLMENFIFCMVIFRTSNSWCFFSFFQILLVP